jgi:hypothetical protein
VSGDDVEREYRGTVVLKAIEINYEDFRAGLASCAGAEFKKASDKHPSVTSTVGPRWVHLPGTLLSPLPPTLESLYSSLSMQVSHIHYHACEVCSATIPYRQSSDAKGLKMCPCRGAFYCGCVDYYYFFPLF